MVSLKPMGQCVQRCAAVLGYAFLGLLLGSVLLGRQVKIVRLAPGGAIYTREECAHVWSKGAMDTVFMGRIPLQPLLDHQELVRERGQNQASPQAPPIGESRE